MLFRELPLLEERLDRITAPTTVVIGTADRIVPLSSAQRLTVQIAGARLVKLDRANHLLPQQRAEQLAEIIAGPARELRGSRRGYGSASRPDSVSGTAGVAGS